jgi:hypothetical protein
LKAESLKRQLSPIETTDGDLEPPACGYVLGEASRSPGQGPLGGEVELVESYKAEALVQLSSTMLAYSI